MAATASERCSRLQRCVAAGVKGYRVADSGLASALLAACAPAAAATGEAAERQQRRTVTDIAIFHRGGCRASQPPYGGAARRRERETNSQHEGRSGDVVLPESKSHY